MDKRILLKKLNGTQTVESVRDILSVSKKQAIYYLARLRKEGYVKTKRLSDNKRVYSISPENRLKGVSYHEIINKNSPIKITTPEIYEIYGKEPSMEETLVYAIKTQKLRIILAALALFRKIEDWPEIYRLSKKNHLERQVGALYDMTRKIMRVRKMTKRFRNHALPKKEDKTHYTIEGLRSKDFKNIESIWRIYIPFNKRDLEDYQ